MDVQHDALTDKRLTRLRELVRDIDGQQGNAVPLGELVALAREWESESGLTIDFRATHELGHPMVVVRVPEHVAEQTVDPRFSHLSPREWDVAELIGEGLSNKQIASRLFITLATVKDHVHQILTKTGLPSRTAVAARIVRRGSR